MTWTNLLPTAPFVLVGNTVLRTVLFHKLNYIIIIIIITITHDKSCQSLSLVTAPYQVTSFNF